MTCHMATPTTGEPLVLVGHVRAFPCHPQPGTVVEPLLTGYEVRAGDHRPDVLYALVSVDWACEYQSVDLDTGERSVEFRTDGSLGTPTGRSWYLTPAVFDESDGRYRLNNRQLARGHRDAHLPTVLVELGAPLTVPIHDFPV
jgi:hypothetical protein